jgi:phage shock protein A
MVEDVKEPRESDERLQQNYKVLQEESKRLKQRVETLEGKLGESENEVKQLREKYEVSQKQSALAAQVFVSLNIIFDRGSAEISIRRIRHFPWQP